MVMFGEGNYMSANDSSNLLDCLKESELAVIKRLELFTV